MTKHSQFEWAGLWSACVIFESTRNRATLPIIQGEVPVVVSNVLSRFCLSRFVRPVYSSFANQSKRIVTWLRGGLVCPVCTFSIASHMSASLNASRALGKEKPRRAMRSRLTPARNMSTAASKDPRQGNVDGQFFVDHTCIDCDTCRWMAPESFARVGSGSAVVQQPRNEAERLAAMQATLSCPTYVLSLPMQSIALFFVLLALFTW